MTEAQKCDYFGYPPTCKVCGAKARFAPPLNEDVAVLLDQLAQAVERVGELEADLETMTRTAANQGDLLDQAQAEVGMLKMGFEPAPTADAYEAVCKARTKWQERAEKAEGDPRLHLMFCKTCKVWHDGEGPCPACDEVKRLRVIADTLPKTADGVPAMAGKSVFSVEVDGSIYANELVWWSFKGGHAALLMHSGYRNRLGVWIDQWKFASECYSTREAALAAKEASDA